MPIYLSSSVCLVVVYSQHNSFFTALLQAQGNIHSTGPSKSSRTNDEGVAVSSEIDLEDNSYFIPLSEIINVPARLQRNLEKTKAESTSCPSGKLHDKGSCSSPTGQVKVETTQGQLCLSWLISRSDLNYHVESTELIL
jgi:hypothetical protein